RLPRNTSTPSPPPKPRISPPLVNTTMTWPVSARDGVTKPVVPDNPSNATTAKCAQPFLIISSPNIIVGLPLLCQEHRKISEHGEQDAGHRVADRESDPGHGALDFHRGLTARAGM